MSVARYREFAYDVFFKSFTLLRKIYADEGAKLIFGIMREALN